MRAWRALAAALVAAALVVTGCSSGAPTTSASSSPSPTPTPTPASVVWAGEVCVARDQLKAAVGNLGHNLDYDVTSDRSALEQIDRQVRLQAIAVGNAADTLMTTLQAVPVDFQAANDFVTTVTRAGTDLKASIDATTQGLDAMVNADSIVNGVAAAAQALVAARAAFAAGQTLVQTVTEAGGAANSDLREAFDQAPACQG